MYVNPCEHTRFIGHRTKANALRSYGISPRRCMAVGGPKIGYGRCRLRFDCRTNRPFRREVAEISGFYTHRKTQYSVLT